MAAILHVHAPSACTTGPPAWRPVAETDLADWLDPLAIDVVVVHPSTARPIEVLQQVRAAAPCASAVVEARQDDADGFRRALRYSPGLPEDIQLLTTSHDLVSVVASARERALRRRRHAALLDSVSRQLPHSHASSNISRLTAIGTLLEHAPLGVVVTDAAGRVLNWNDQAAVMLDLDPDANGRPLAEVFSDSTQVALALARSISSLEIVAGIQADRGDNGGGSGGGSAFELSFAPTRSDDGSPAVLGLLIDVTERRRAERARDELAERLEASSAAQAFLLKASDVMIRAESYIATLESLAAIAVPTLGELCLIDVIDETGHPQRIAARHADPARQALAEELRRCYPPDADSDQPIARSIRDGRSRWSPSVGEDFLRTISHDDQHLRLLQKIKVSGYITVPLLSGNRTLGTVTLISCDDRHFTVSDLRLAEALAERVATVVDKARLYDREHLVAISLQRAMQTALPDVSPVQIAARYVPAREDTEVGGDWYDVFALPSGSIALVIGDVVGHDLAAATRMGELRNLLRGLALDRQEAPSDILLRLGRLNEALAITDFATVIYGMLETDHAGNYLYRWVNAGHLPPLLTGADGITRSLNGNLDVALGTPAEHRRAEDAVHLPAGSTLLLYTDGLVETRSDQLEVGLGALVQRCTELAGQRLDDFTDGILGELPAHSDDDIAILAVRIPDGDAE